MRYLDVTLGSPAENLALDEALLVEAEMAAPPTETLRIWEPRRPMIVVGRSSKIAQEVRLDACRERDLSVLRRISGGAAVVAGPGCLMYSVVLSCRARPALRAADRAHRFVLGTLASALEPLVPGVKCRGTSDLAIGELKFSGNSLRLKRNHLLYHGTLMYDFPLELVDRCLAMPPRRPEYRRDRPHATFLTNLPLEAAAMRQSLIAAWGVTQQRTDWPRESTARLVAEKYGRPQWNEHP